jgi:hypothetical protein
LPWTDDQFKECHCQGFKRGARFESILLGFDPHQNSNTFGSDYMTVRITGHHAATLYDAAVAIPFNAQNTSDRIRCTRFDLAVDIDDRFLSPYWDIDGSIVTAYSTTKKTVTSDSDGGFTIYVGSRQSDKMLRLYDKGAEQGQQPETWYRLELEIKAGQADANWRRIAKKPGEVAAAYLEQILDVQQSHPIFADVMKFLGDVSELDKPSVSRDLVTMTAAMLRQYGNLWASLADNSEIVASLINYARVRTIDPRYMDLQDPEIADKILTVIRAATRPRKMTIVDIDGVPDHDE